MALRLPLPGPVLQLPGRRLDPLRLLVRRLAGACAVILLVATLAYLDRDGYTDGAGGSLTALDAVYYATVTLTTTGYGDVYPATQTARAVTAFVITPLRVVFLILLVGTTVELLTESTRHAWRVRRWRKTVLDHVVVCGYGAKGLAAVEALVGNGLPADRIAVIELDRERAELALAAGHPVVQGDATRTAMLVEADIADARSVIVAVDRDDTAILTVLTARELNPGAHIAATVQEEENAHLLSQSGANTVVPSTSASGRLVGISSFSPALVDVLDDLLRVGHGIELGERLAGPDDLGPLSETAHRQVVLVLRDGELLLRHDPRVEPIRAGDRLIEMTTAAGG